MIRHIDNADRVHRGAAPVARLAAAGILALTAVAGCAGGGSPTPGAPASADATSVVVSATNSPALCAAASEFQTAANAIVHLNASAVGVDGVKAALQQLRTAGANLATAAKDQLAPQVDNLPQALNGLQTTVAGLTDQSSPSSKLGAIAASVGAVEQAAKPILDSVAPTCPSIPTAEPPSGS
jgi:hypothetical protein